MRLELVRVHALVAAAAPAGRGQARRCLELDGLARRESCKTIGFFFTFMPFS